MRASFRLYNSMTFKLYLVAAALLLLASCKKDGVFNPSAKLSAISEYSQVSYQKYVDSIQSWHQISENVVKRHTVEGWVWNGNTLSAINYYRDGKIDHSLYFTYDGKQLSRIDDNSNGTHAECLYDGRKLDEMRFYDKNGKQKMTYIFTHDGRHISTINVETKGNTKESCSFDAIENFALQMMLPETAGCDLRQARNGIKSDSEITLNLKWKDDNIKSIEYSGHNSLKKATYKHDKNKNPYRSFIGTLASGSTPHDLFLFGNKNNITSSTIINNDGSGEKKSYSYTYSEEYPTSQSQCIIDNVTQGYRYVTTQIRYYEYVE